jgi:hypothetical protein
MVLHRVRGDCPFAYPLVAEPGIYEPFLNRYGAVAVKIGDEFLGLKPAEFLWLDEPPREIYENQ